MGLAQIPLGVAFRVMSGATRKPDLIPMQDVLRSFRLRYGLTQTQVGQAMGKNQSWVSRLEQHRPGDNRYRPINYDEVTRVEDFFKVPRGTLYRMAGRVEDQADVLSMLEADTHIAPEDAALLAGMYVQMQTRYQARTSRRRTRLVAAGA